MVVEGDLSDVRGVFDGVFPVVFQVCFFVVVLWLLWQVLECEGEGGEDGEVVAADVVAHLEVVECG